MAYSKLKWLIKAVLQKAGLWSLAIRLKAFTRKGELTLFAQSLRGYLFNNVLTFMPIHWLRVFYLRHCMCVEVGKDSFISMGCRFEGDINIGHHSVIGRGCVLNGHGQIVIGNNVSITAETYIFTATHDANCPVFSAFSRPVVIEDHAWIGARAMVFPGVRIGRGAILGALSAATKSVPNWAIAVGVPARTIGQRTDTIDYTITYKPYFQ